MNSLNLFNQVMHISFFSKSNTSSSLSPYLHLLSFFTFSVIRHGYHYLLSLFPSIHLLSQSLPGIPQSLPYLSSSLSSLFLSPILSSLFIFFRYHYHLPFSLALLSLSLYPFLHLPFLILSSLSISISIFCFIPLLLHPPFLSFYLPSFLISLSPYSISDLHRFKNYFFPTFIFSLSLPSVHRHHHLSLFPQPFTSYLVHSDLWHPRRAQISL